MARVTIIGYGNPLRGDDGLGWHAVNRLAEKIRRNQGEGRRVAGARTADLKVLSRQQLAPELTEEIAGAGLVIFIDANCQQPPGRWTCESVKPRATYSAALTHHFAPADLLALAEALHGKCSRKAFLLTAGGEYFGYQEGLSGALIEALSELEELVAACIRNNSDPSQGVVSWAEDC
jgi:hydrogenase maturation protease